MNTFVIDPGMQSCSPPPLACACFIISAHHFLPSFFPPVTTPHSPSPTLPMLLLFHFLSLHLHPPSPLGCNDGLCYYLTKPCPNSTPLTMGLARDAWEVPRETLALQTKLGQGCFGDVWMGETDALYRLRGKTVCPASSSVVSVIVLLKRLSLMLAVAGHFCPSMQTKYCFYQ